MAAATAPDQKGVLLTVWATHDFVAENEDELPFYAGEPVEVLEKDEEFGDGWWLGRDSNERVGLFPASFVTDIPPEGEGLAGEHESSYSVSGASEPQSVHSSVGVDQSVEPRGLQSSTRRGEGNESVDNPGNIELANLVAAAIAAARADGAPIPSDENDEVKVVNTANVAAPLLAERLTGRGSGSSPEEIQQEYDDTMREIEASRTSRPQAGGGGATALRCDSNVTAPGGRREWGRQVVEEVASPSVWSPPGKPKLPPLKTGSADVAAAVENLAISIGKEEHDQSSPPNATQRVDGRPPLTAGVTYGSNIFASGAFQQPKSDIPQGHPRNWSINDVYNWLISRGFEADAASFAENEITGAILLELDLTTLKELGVTSFGKRFNMMHAVADLKEEWGLCIVTPVVSDNLVLSTTNSSLGLSSEALDDSSVRVPSSGKMASMTSQESGFKSEGRGDYLRRDSTSQVLMPETDAASFRSEGRGNIFRRDSTSQSTIPEMDAAATGEFRRKPISSLYSSASAQPPDVESLRPVRRFSRTGSVATRPAPTPPRTRGNDFTQKPHAVVGGSHPCQPAIPARYSSVPGVDEFRPPTNLKAPKNDSNPGPQAK
ncbi:MAG: hypothetical protein BJ554DRAFT_340 [Olpidium bornovanus]|uniref:Uncharacterized protein n=1 Tax=Olpidium bornovanus TaxID=278681 RepID=A0A8H8DI83_9FUNG|nr:MAG: hypothetical protein BJ554DRAFT_340 [Olpidium bornovanus]